MAIAFFSTWTTYGTLLPGDQRGWYQPGSGLCKRDPMRQLEAALRMTESAITLEPEQRRIVEDTIAKHCAIRKWHLHAVNCRSNHVHAVVTAPGRALELPREQFKAWCTRRLSEHEQSRTSLLREHWWTDRGWDEYVDTDKDLADVILYVKDGQGPR